MANIEVTAAQVAQCFVKYGKAEIYDVIAGEALTAGLPVFIYTDGRAYIADANAAGELQVRGITLNAADLGGAVSILQHGPMYGFTLTSQAYDALIYLSNDVGRLADAAGATTVIVGRVFPLSDRPAGGATPTKVLFVDIPMANADWS